MHMLNLNNILDIKITKKLTILFITVTLGFVVIAIAYWIIIKNEREATEKSNLYIKYGQLVSDAQNNFSKVRRYEKDYLLSIFSSTNQTFNKEPLVKHTKYLSLLEQNMEQLNELSISNNFKISEEFVIDEVGLPINYQSQYIAQASAVAKYYKTTFSEIVESNQAMGFMGIEGLRQKAKRLLDTIEIEVQGASTNTVQSILASIRANEKNILQSINIAESFEGLKNQHQELHTNIKNLKFREKLDSSNLESLMSNYLDTINEIVSNKNKVKEYTGLYDLMLGPIFWEMGKYSALSILQNQSTQENKTNTIAGIVALTLIAIAALISLLMYLFGYTITKPINKLVDTIHEVNKGNLEARTHLERKDELGELSTAFDRLLDEKVTQLSLSEKNNDVLNESIISLLTSVAQLSKKDFTVVAPVFEDVTGALGDSLNYLTKETATALSDVKEISVRVVVESNRVQRQAKLVMAVAEKERRQVEGIMGELNKSSNEMVKMSTYATDVSKKAEYALRNTHSALETVDRSVAGINGIRKTIRQTEKRIKRLGERSQEITGIVNLMNSIAERTHILALNASMHAASSGEKGRGFSVVAEEVQRLAESARDATTEIESLVSNIRIETKDAVSAMNTAITQVADGTALAEKAGSAMRETQESTQDLVQAVNSITKSSKMQAHANLQLVENANEILEGTRKTDQHLHQQMTTTNNLVRYSNMLLTTVGIFKLPVVEHEDKLTNISVEGIQNKKTNIGVTSAEEVNLNPAAKVKVLENA